MVQAAANAVAALRALASEPALRGATTLAAGLAVALLPMLQHTTRTGLPTCVLLVQYEVLLLEQQLLANGAAEVPAPLPEGVLQPGPPRGADMATSLRWYSLQQCLLCSLQVRRAYCLHPAGCCCCAVVEYVHFHEQLLLQQLNPFPARKHLPKRTMPMITSVTAQRGNTALTRDATCAGLCGAAAAAVSGDNVRGSAAQQRRAAVCHHACRPGPLPVAAAQAPHCSCPCAASTAGAGNTFDTSRRFRVCSLPWLYFTCHLDLECSLEHCLGFLCLYMFSLCSQHLLHAADRVCSFQICESQQTGLASTTSAYPSALDLSPPLALQGA